jgi:hypothetical protein
VLSLVGVQDDIGVMNGLVGFFIFWGAKNFADFLFLVTSLVTTPTIMIRKNTQANAQTRVNSRKYVVPAELTLVSIMLDVVMLLMLLVKFVIWPVVSIFCVTTTLVVGTIFILLASILSKI